jgi:hypothetical protein
LEPNFPNPFNPTTTIACSLLSAGRVRLAVYDPLGREIAILVDGPQTAGRHSVPFDAGRLSSGMYLYRLKTNSGVLAGRMVLLK